MVIKKKQYFLGTIIVVSTKDSKGNMLNNLEMDININISSDVTCIKDTLENNRMKTVKNNYQLTCGQWFLDKSNLILPMKRYSDQPLLPQQAWKCQCLCNAPDILNNSLQGKTC